MNEEIYSQRIENLINQNKNYIFILGINATWHFYLYKKLINNENTFFFFDFYIYIANKYSYLYYSKFDKVLFGFYYIEDAKLIESKIKTDDNFPLFEIFDFNPPLFISRGCLQRNLINSNKCSDNCRKKYLYEFKNQKKEFLYIIDECISYLFEKKP